MINKMQRILEPQVMEREEEALAYERMLKLYGFVVMRLLLNSLSYLGKGDKKALVLDIGCGPALVARAVAQKYHIAEFIRLICLRLC